jgi:hypothetical protein
LKPSEKEGKFGNWTEFYQITNQRSGHKICDCHRIRNEYDSIIENRYYDDGDIKITYIQLFGSTSHMRGHRVSLLNLSSCRESRCAQTLCQPGMCAPSILPLDDFGTILQPGTFRRAAGSIPSSHVFLNAGVWWKVKGKNSLAPHKEFVVREVLNFKNDNPGVRVHWKMTTASKIRYSPEFEFAWSLVKSGAFDSVYDAWSLTVKIVEENPELMWDANHFEGPAYKGLNQALIAYLWSLGKEK